MPSPSEPLSPGLTVLSAAAGLALVAFGIGAAAAPVPAARLYGIPTTGDSAAYVKAAGVRDLAAGAILAALAVRRDRPAVGLTVLLGTLIPIGDGWLALRHSPAPARSVPLHWGSALAAVVFAGVLLRPRNRV